MYPIFHCTVIGKIWVQEAGGYCIKDQTQPGFGKCHKFLCNPFWFLSLYQCKAMYSFRLTYNHKTLLVRKLLDENTWKHPIVMFRLIIIWWWWWKPEVMECTLFPGPSTPLACSPSPSPGHPSRVSRLFLSCLTLAKNIPGWKTLCTQALQPFLSSASLWSVGKSFISNYHSTLLNQQVAFIWWHLFGGIYLGAFNEWHL